MWTECHQNWNMPIINFSYSPSQTRCCKYVNCLRSITSQKYISDQVMVTADHARNMPWMSGCMELFNRKQIRTHEKQTLSQVLVPGEEIHKKWPQQERITQGHTRTWETTHHFYLFVSLGKATIRPPHRHQMGIYEPSISVHLFQFFLLIALNHFFLFKHRQLIYNPKSTEL